jgi:hypothetical protein
MKDKFRSKVGRQRVLSRFFAHVRRTLVATVPGFDNTCRKKTFHVIEASPSSSTTKRWRFKDVVLAWGDAKVSPTGRGNVAVPTRGVGRLAALIFRKTFRPSDEFCTSQGCPDCHCKVHAVRVVAHGVNVRERRPTARETVSRLIRKGLLVDGGTKRRIKRLKKRAEAGLSLRARVQTRQTCSVRWRVDGHGGESDEEKKKKREARGPDCYVEYKRGFRFCPGCQKLRDRDDMAADNIAQLWLWDHCGGQRPDIFDRTKAKQHACRAKKKTSGAAPQARRRRAKSSV